MTLGQQILIARKNKKYTQKQLADLVEMTNMQICNIEQGKNNPQISTLRKISKILDVKFDL